MANTNSQTDTPSSPADVSRFSHLRWLWSERVVGSVIFLLAIVVLVACLQRWDGWVGSGRFQKTDDAYLQTDLTPLAARVAGYVREVPAQDFDIVHKGQLLVQIDDDDYRAGLAQAEANALVAEAAIGNVRAQEGLQRATIRAASATVTASRAVAERALSASRRQNVLLTGGAGSQDAGEASRASAQVATAQVLRDLANEAAAQQQLLVLASQVRQAQAAAVAARAAADIARINLRHTRIIAPQDGTIGQRQVHPGQYVAIGSQVTTLAPLPKVWVLANYKETQLTNLRIGQRASIGIDAFPGLNLAGRVTGYAPASGSQFSLLPADNATGNFTKIVQRLAVKIELDDIGHLDPRLRPGMSVVATVDTAGRP